jgi:eukaryotic-like serine/threonine-protein kinase
MGESARDATLWEPPKAFDSFEIERPLGGGGMGQVYLGRDTMLDRKVALKFIAADSPSAEARKRFIIEARAIAKLAHPNVVGVFRIGEVEARPYIAYEHVDGQSLDAIHRPVGWGAALRIATLLARGLEAAHRVGIVHRDIKPSNVMLSSTGDVKLLDFGIAKLEFMDGLRDEISLPPPPPLADIALAATQSEAAGKVTARRAGLTRPGALIGTPAYLAPEMWAGESASPRSDVFAAGLVMFELVTGALPFAPLVGQALAEAVLTGDAPSVRSRRPEIPPAFATIIDTCLRRDPRARYETAAELRAELEKVKSVYLHSAHGHEVRFTGEARIVADSFARVLPRVDELVSGVYTKLFAADPQTRSLFPEDITAQKAKLSHALKLAIEGLHEPERIVDMLRELGRRHTGYGVTPSHFDTLGQVLHATVRELDAPAWNDELSTAWRQAYGFIAASMRQGLSGVAETAVSEAGGALTPASSRATPASGPSPSVQPVSTPPLPRTQYARNGDVSLAYHVLGEGPDLVVALGWVTHLELSYGHPSLRDFLFTLARRHRVILFDKRGTGLSDRVLHDVTFEERADDIRAVMDAAGSTRAAMLGVSEGAGLAAYFAAIHPERVSGLALWGASPCMLNKPGYGAGLEPAFLEQVFGIIQERWGDTFFAELEAPSMVGDRTFAEWLATYMRMAASPGNAIAMLKANAASDLRRILPAVGVPVLVMHNRGDRVVPLSAGKAFAALVPRATWMELEGDDHTPFTGDVSRVTRSILDFFAQMSAEAAVQPARVGMVVAVRDASDEGVIRAEAVRCAGRELIAGVFVFDGLVRALSLATVAARAGARVGVHLGPVPEDSEVSAIETVGIALAVADHAPAGEVRATELVRDIGHAMPFELAQSGTSLVTSAGPLEMVAVRRR